MPNKSPNYGAKLRPERRKGRTMARAVINVGAQLGVNFESQMWGGALASVRVVRLSGRTVLAFGETVTGQKGN